VLQFAIAQGGNIKAPKKTAPSSVPLKNLQEKQLFAVFYSEGGMDGYAQFCPIAQASEVLVRRWMPLVIRELLCGSRHFNDIHRGVPRMSRSLLARRLGELEEAGLVERRSAAADGRPEYHLTAAGEALRPLILRLGEWGKAWLRKEPSREHLDARLLMWDLQRRIVTEHLPDGQVVVLFRFADAPQGQRSYWLVLNGGAVDLCLKDPGYPIDLHVRADLRVFTRVWLGDIALHRALHEQSIVLSGPTRLRRQFPQWLGLSLFAGVARQPVGSR
jgi:DNA-binding HxlR family transcriptional regulator